MGVVAVVLVVLASSRIDPNDGERALDTFAYLLMVVAGGALVWRLREPLVVAGVVGAAIVVYLARDYAGDAILLVGPIALHGVASTCRRQVTYGVAAGLVAAVLAAGALAGDGIGAMGLVFVGWAAAAVFAVEAAAAQQARRAEERRRLLVEERLRIARDLHDSVGHAMAAINVQSGVAAHLIRRGPAQDALEAIRRTSAEVLDELTSVLEALRDDGLAEIDALVESARRSGVDVAVSTVGPVDTVPVPVGAAAYRIVQEALTNVIRHAEGAPTLLVVSADEQGGLAILVDDEGPGPHGSPAGRGITGMRERVAATGGILATGASPSGGFRVAARWPGAS